MNSAILADDMGLGKSLQALTVFGIDVFMGRSTSAIIVSPVTLKGNWADEIDKFTRFRFTVLGEGVKPNGRPKTLTKAERTKQIENFREAIGPKILIVNYEQVDPHVEELNACRFDMVIFDEAHYLKNPKAKRTKACMKLETRRSFLLSGTPMRNRVDELWPLLYRVDPVTYANYWSFRNRYCVFGGWQNKQIVGVQNEAELTTRLQSVMLRRLKKDVLNLKEPQYIQRRVNLSPQQQELYDEVMNEMQMTLPDNPDPMDIENALTKFLRAKQICATTATVLGLEEDHSNKLDLVTDDSIEILEGGNKIVVWTQFRMVIEAYKQRMKKALKSEGLNVPIFELHGDVPIPTRQPIVAQWSAVPGPAVMIGMLQVAGVGLNMTAARHAQFIDKLFVPGDNQQAVDRIHRIGQDETQPVQVFEYITRNTIENRIEQILKDKKILFGNVVEGASGSAGWKRKLIEAALSGDD